eukprot:544900-Alexandrium_andersonii.AAC.1
MLKEKGYGCVFSPCDPEASKPSGGVAIACKRPRLCQPCIPRTTGFARAIELGRAVMTMLSLGRAVPLLVVSIYGWAKDGDEFNRFERSSGLLLAVFLSLIHI